MKHTIALVVCACGLACGAPGGPPSKPPITGIVRGDDGTVIAGAYVTLSRMPPYPPGRVRRTEWSASTDSAGIFRLDDLDSGRYQLCAQALSTGWVNPCGWDEHPGVTLISAATTNKGLNVILSRGAVLRVRFDDPGELLGQYEGKTTGASLLVGVGGAAALFHVARIASKDRTGREYQITIPLNRAVKLVVQSGVFLLNDASGQPLPSRTTVIPVRVAAGQPEPTITLRVSNILK